MSPTIFAIELVVKATAVLLAAGAGSVLLRSSPACYRHRLLALALVGTATLPALSLLLPGWRLAVLPSRDVPMNAFLSRSAGQAAPPAVSAVEVLRPPAAIARNAATHAAPAHNAAPAQKPFDKSVFAATGRSQAAMAQPAKRPAPRRWSLIEGLLLLWLGGVGVVLFRAGLSWRRLRRLEARSAPMPVGAATRMLCELQAQFRLPRSVQLRCVEAPEPVAPATWGLIRATILLPAEAQSWSEERLRAVLTHELSHVRRGDWAWQVLAGAVCTVYWFHPGVWWTAGRMRWEAELACDDEVLSAGIPAADYARQLLEVVQMVRKEGDAGTLVTTMGRPARLSTRLEAILDPRRHRAVDGRAASVMLAAAVVTAVSLISSSRVSARAESLPLSHSSRAVRVAAFAVDAAPRTVPAAVAEVMPSEPQADVPGEPTSGLADVARSDMPPAWGDSPATGTNTAVTTPPVATTEVRAEDHPAPAATTTTPPSATDSAPGAARATTPPVTRSSGSEQLAALMDRRKALEQELKLIDERIEILHQQYRAGVVLQDEVLQATIQRAHVQATIAQNDAFLQSLGNGRFALRPDGTQATRAAEVAVAEARLDQAKAQVQAAEASLARVEKLVAAHAATDAELQQAQAELRSRQAGLNLTQAELARQKVALQNAPAHDAGDAVGVVVDGVRARLERVRAEEKSLEAALQQAPAKKEGAGHATDRLKRALDGIRKERHDLERLLQDLQKDGGKHSQATPPAADPVELATLQAKIQEQETVLASVRELRKITDARFVAGVATRADGLKLEVQEQDALQSLAALRARMAELRSAKNARPGY